MIQELDRSFLFLSSSDTANITLTLDENVNAFNKRTDGKLILTADSDGIINGKFPWYTLNYTKLTSAKIPESTICFLNNKHIEKSIEKVLTVYSIEYSYQKYLIPFILDELVKFTEEYIKCDIFNIESTNKYYPLEISNADFIKRHLIKFGQVKKKVKDNINTKYIHKTGDNRLFEYIFDFNRKGEQAKEA